MNMLQTKEVISALRVMVACETLQISQFSEIPKRLIRNTNLQEAKTMAQDVISSLNGACLSILGYCDRRFRQFCESCINLHKSSLL